MEVEKTLWDQPDSGRISIKSGWVSNFFQPPTLPSDIFAASKPTRVYNTWFISVWRQKTKAMARLLSYVGSKYPCMLLCSLLTMDLERSISIQANIQNLVLFRLMKSLITNHFLPDFIQVWSCKLPRANVSTTVACKKTFPIFIFPYKLFMFTTLEMTKNML